AFDACVLIYLTASYRWFAHQVPDVSTAAAIVVYAIAYAVIAIVTVFEVGVVLAIGAGIARQFRPAILSSRWWVALAAIPSLSLLIALLVWVFYLYPIAAIRNAARVDRLEVFKQLTEAAGSLWRPLGLMGNDRLSIGLFFAVLIAIAYL